MREYRCRRGEQDAEKEERKKRRGQKQAHRGDAHGNVTWKRMIMQVSLAGNADTIKLREDASSVMRPERRGRPLAFVACVVSFNLLHVVAGSRHVA